MRLFLLFALLVCVLLCGSCKKYGPSDAAFFIKAGPISVASNTATEGSSSHKITDLWLYVNGQFQAVYPLGNLMPIVTKNKTAKIQIFAGIKNNGIADTRIPWSFYDLVEFDTLVETGKTINRSFSFKYNATTHFVWKENFDEAGFSLTKSLISDTVGGITTSANSFEGKSYELGLSSANSSSIAQVESTGSGFSLPRGSEKVYLELNYKGNSVFDLGLIGEDTKLKQAIMINPQENWNKIYVQLGNAVSDGVYSSKYKVYFRLLKQADNQSPKIFLDNIKLIYL